MLDTKSMKFSTMGEMKVAKTFNGQVHMHEGFIYAFGGNEKDICERYDTYNNKWENVSSYNDICKANELNGWT
jgi:hypothetical protein